LTTVKTVGNFIMEELDPLQDLEDITSAQRQPKPRIARVVSDHSNSNKSSGSSSKGFAAASSLLSVPSLKMPAFATQFSASSTATTKVSKSKPTSRRNRLGARRLDSSLDDSENDVFVQGRELDEIKIAPSDQ
jgi:hypothetical protein